LDTPLSGNWFIQKDFTGIRTQIGSGFEINVNSSNLTGPGLYLVTFQTTTADYPDCISEKIIGFEITESPKFTTTLLDQPDECSSQNGSFVIQLESDVDALYIPDLDVIEGMLSSGDERTFGNLRSQVYSIVV
jgi:hypothetical protein